MSLEIRQAREEDFDAYTAVRDAAWEQAYGHFLPHSTFGPESHRRLRELWPGRIHDSLGFFLAVQHERVVGYATVVVNHEPDVDADTMLAALYVHPDAQGHGISHWLTHACAHRARRVGPVMAIAAFQENSRAREIYRGWGGESIGFGTYSVKGVDYPDERFLFRNLATLQHRLLPLDPEILVAEPSVVTAVTQLVHRAYARHAEAGLQFLATYQDEAVTAERMEDSTTYGFRIGGALVATVGVKYDRSPAYGGYRAEGRLASFSQFAVEPRIQSVGLGRRILRWVEEECVRRGIEELACDTAAPATGLVEYYTGLGYEKVADADWRPTTNYLSVILRKRLV